MSESIKTSYDCPDCDRPILNRKFNKCLYCGATIPEELLFTDLEIQEKQARYQKQIENYEKERNRYRNTKSSQSLFGSDFSHFLDIGDFDGDE